MGVIRAAGVALVVAAMGLAGLGWAQVPKAPAPRSAEDPRSLFRFLDKDRDGKLTKDEFAAIYRDRAKADQTFQWYDKNGDGVITEDEFLVPPDEMEQKMKSEKPQPAG